MSVSPYKAIYRFLDTNGDGTGTKNANGNYATVADEFYYTATKACEIHRLIVHINDAASMDADDYGNLLAPLTNGYAVKVKDAEGDDLIDLCDGTVITSNGSLGRYCYDVDLKTWSAGSEFLQARWTFARAGNPLYLPKDHRLSITFNDDLSGLIEHYFMIQGYQV